MSDLSWLEDLLSSGWFGVAVTALVTSMTLSDVEPG